MFTAERSKLIIAVAFLTSLVFHGSSISGRVLSPRNFSLVRTELGGAEEVTKPSSHYGASPQNLACNADSERVSM
jgi:hypothetical protein